MPKKFHNYHGPNIAFFENQTVATRPEGIGYGIVFSENQLNPGELFVIEIEQNETGWCGYLRLGLTTLDPSQISANEDFYLPVFSIPTLDTVSPTWVFPVSEIKLNYGLQYPITWPLEIDAWPMGIDARKINISEEYIETCRGRYSLMNLRPSVFSRDETKDLEVGHRVGVTYIPVDENLAELYFIINGNVYGPYARDLPYIEYPLYAVVDLYGKTKKVRVTQLQAEKSLKQMCRIVIRKTFTTENIKNLSLPRSIIDYLLFKSNTS